jgi:uncharacterized membrane protein (UPF0127 family)
MIPQEQSIQNSEARSTYLRWLSVGVISAIVFGVVSYRSESQSTSQQSQSDSEFQSRPQSGISPSTATQVTSDVTQVAPTSASLDTPYMLAQAPSANMRSMSTQIEGAPYARPVFDSVSDITYRTIDIKVRGVTSTAYAVQVADTGPARTLGLSNRTFLAEGTGLLFIFEKDGYYPFWMKDMNFPIDIIWIDTQKQIVHIAQNVSPDTYPSTFASKELARYVLEIPAGDAHRYGFEKGTRVDF